MRAILGLEETQVTVLAASSGCTVALRLIVGSSHMSISVSTGESSSSVMSIVSTLLTMVISWVSNAASSALLSFAVARTVIVVRVSTLFAVTTPFESIEATCRSASSGMDQATALLEAFEGVIAAVSEILLFSGISSAPLISRAFTRFTMVTAQAAYFLLPSFAVAVILILPVFFAVTVQTSGLSLSTAMVAILVLAMDHLIGVSAGTTWAVRVNVLKPSPRSKVMLVISSSSSFRILTTVGSPIAISGG